jgi:hypothetical protein
LRFLSEANIEISSIFERGSKHKARKLGYLYTKPWQLLIEGFSPGAGLRPVVQQQSGLQRKPQYKDSRC